MSSGSFARRAARLAPHMPAPAARQAIAFESGHAFPAVLPDLTRESATALSRYRTETLQYAPRAGLPELRHWIADYLAADGARVSADDVLVTNGAKHALELVCRALVDDGDAVVVTKPTYYSGIPIIRSFGAEFVEIGQDQDGLDVEELAALLARWHAERRALPKFVYNVSDYHNPTGLTMSLERRRALIALGHRYHMPIVEDSPYRTIRFEGDVVPAVKALDREGVVIHLGTFSKLLAPGLRVGWAVGAAELIARMAQLKSDAGTCPLTQRVILEFVTADRLAEHTRRVQDTYRAHRDRMVAALRRELPEVRFELPHGGYYLWLTLPTAVDGDALAERAETAGVLILPGSRCFARADAGATRHHARLAFSHATLDEIDEGVRRLATAYRSVVTHDAMPAPAPR